MVTRCVMKNDKKEMIWDLFDQKENANDIQTMILEYENEFSDDMDIFLMKMCLFIYENKIQAAIEIGKQALRKNPYLLEIHLKLAEAYKDQSKYIEAYKHYCISKLLASFAGEEKICRDCELLAKGSLEQLEELITYLPDEQKIYLSQKMIPAFLGYEKNQFGYNERRFRTFEHIGGDYYYESEEVKKYVGMYHRPMYVINELDAVHWKIEFQEVVEANYLKLPDTEKKWIVPVAVEKNTTHWFETDNGKMPVIQRDIKSFYYYRVGGGREIISSDICYWGNPIPIKSDKNKKRLVLSIFVDGLAQVLLTADKFAYLMPNTAKFFKIGMVCKQAYSSGEWTYPSIAGVMSGLATTQHMMFHNEIDWKLPNSVKTLMEYFHESGYYTSAFSGDWRIIPSYGYARGCDRFIYQLQYTGFSVEKMIGGVINEIDALKEINQFVWVSLGDLHDVADEMELPTSVQTHLKIEDRVCEKGSETSVKQKYDMAKKIQYEQMLQYMDRYLGMLFSYLENTYEENELIVALFSDHGQGFLIPEDGQFLGPERTNIAFMFRNGQLKGETEEVMSSLDYTAILCKMAGIAYCEQGVEGRTPRIFGGSGRRWALTESLHPKDYYRAALVSENYRFYFCNPIPVGYDGRFEIGDYSICLTDKEGRNVYAEDVEKECLDIIMRQIANLCIY